MKKASNIKNPLMLWYFVTRLCKTYIVDLFNNTMTHVSDYYSKLYSTQKLNYMKFGFMNFAMTEYGPERPV